MYFLKKNNPTLISVVFQHIKGSKARPNLAHVTERTDEEEAREPAGFYAPVARTQVALNESQTSKVHHHHDPITISVG